MKTLEIIITILVCFIILLFVQKQSKKIQYERNSVIIKDIENHYKKQGQLQL